MAPSAHSLVDWIGGMGASQGGGLQPSAAREVNGSGSRPAECSVRLLGPLEVGAGGVVAALGAPKQRALLVALALRPNETVPTARLVEQVWGARAPRTAEHSIQIYVSELRRALARVAGTAQIATCSPGYQLVAPAEALDTVRFERLLRDGRNALRGGRPDIAVTALHSALGLWRGDPLADLAYEEVAQSFARRWRGLRVDAVEALAGAELELGHVDEALDLALHVLAQDPFRDKGCELAMLALYRAGRHVDALSAYREHRQRLAEELGVEPSPLLRELHEKVLLHDASLLPMRQQLEAESPTGNPYKGLLAFTEQDAAYFFGRDDLVDRALEKLRAGARLVTLVGPSGSGKSSVVAAGIIPALRASVADGSEPWQVQLVSPGGGRSALNAVPPTGRVLLVLDQLEDLFLGADATARRAFVDALLTILGEGTGRVSAVATLRADFYDRPLLDPPLAEVFVPAVINVLPLTPPQLRAAVVGPAERCGLDVEPALVPELVADAVNQPGSLPLLQYALTEQVEQLARTGGRVLTLAGYHALGGLRGVVARRADAVYDDLNDAERHVARQVLLRMVRPGRGAPDGRRAVPVSELTGLGMNEVALSAVLGRLGDQRLLSVSRDPLTGSPSVDLAHEALLTQWGRFAAWVEEYRLSLRRLEAVRLAARDWEESGRRPDYLVTGARLAELEEWSESGGLLLTAAEMAYLRAARTREQTLEANEQARWNAHRRQERRFRRRLLASASLTLALLGALTVGLLPDSQGPSEVALVTHGVGEVNELIDSGFVRAVSEFGLISSRTVVDPGAEAELAKVSQDGADLVVALALDTDVESVADRFPGTNYVMINGVGAAHNLANIEFAANEGAYLAGAAAALTSSTGVIAFLGGVDADPIWSFQAGFAAGARRVDPDVTVLTRYLSQPPQYSEGFLNPDGGKRAAASLYDAGADVVFAAAGKSGLGVIDAAAESSAAAGRHLWAIGVDSDQYRTVVDLPGSVGAAQWREHILTSVVLRYDTAVYSVLAAEARGQFQPGTHRLGLAEHAVDISYSGGYLDGIRTQLETLRAEILAAAVIVPCSTASRTPTAPDAAECQS